MAETLGSLCDKLTIVKLKQWHASEELKLKSLSSQQSQLEEEINQFIYDAVLGLIPLQRLTFAANKVYTPDENLVIEIYGSIGQNISQLAAINCELWHEQEKVYDFKKIPIGEKDMLVKSLARLNIERTRCVDEIDKNLVQAIVSYNETHSGERKCI